MQKTFLKQMKIFLISLISCMLLFGSIACFSIKKNITDHAALKPTYSNIPYSTKKIVFLLNTKELPTSFILTLAPKTNRFSVSAIPNNSVKKSSIPLNQCLKQKDYINFFEQEINYTINLSNLALSKIIDFSNGIVANTTYGIPSPAGNLLIDDGKDKTRLYSGSVLKLLSLEAQPNTDELKYSAYLICLIVKAFLTDLNDDKYFLLKKYSEMDLSYANYYDNKALIKKCVNNYEASFYDGVWIDDLYYLV